MGRRKMDEFDPDEVDRVAELVEPEPMPTPAVNPLMIPGVRPGMQLRTMKPRQETPLTECPTNLDLSSWEGRARIIAAGNPGDLEMPTNGELKVNVTHYVIFPDERVDEETGEVKEFCRTVFFDASGKTFRTSADHAPRRLGAMLQMYSPEEWAAGIPIIIRARMGKRGRLYHDIRVAEKR